MLTYEYNYQHDHGRYFRTCTQISFIVVEFSTGNVDNAMGMVSSNKKAGKGKLDIDQLDIPGVSEKSIAV